MPKHIGIAITTMNRPDLLEKCLANFDKFRVPYSELVVVDDHSNQEIAMVNEQVTNKYSFQYRRNPKRLGINRSKNKCIEYLDHCDYVFLFDDDIWPLKEGWEKPWIEASVATNIHFFDYCYNPYPANKKDDPAIRMVGGIKLGIYRCAMGHMLFMTSVSITLLGGMDLRYRLYGAEHDGLSHRAFNAGLTKQMLHVSLPDHIDDFYSMDKLDPTRQKSTVTDRARKTLVQVNGAIMAEYDSKSTNFCLYKKQDYIITTYFTKNQGPTLDSGLNPNNMQLVNTWYNYVLDHNLNGIILHDGLSDDFIRKCISDNVKFMRCNENDALGFPANAYALIALNDFVAINKEYIGNLVYTNLIHSYTENLFVNLDRILLCEGNAIPEDTHIYVNQFLENYNPTYDVVYDPTILGGPLPLIQPIIKDLAHYCKHYAKIPYDITGAIFNHVVNNIQDPTRMITCRVPLLCVTIMHNDETCIGDFEICLTETIKYTPDHDHDIVVIDSTNNPTIQQMCKDKNISYRNTFPKEITYNYIITLHDTIWPKVNGWTRHLLDALRDTNQPFIAVTFDKFKNGDPNSSNVLIDDKYDHVTQLTMYEKASANGPLSSVTPR